jgi:peptide/nickel transport system permease protein
MYGQLFPNALTPLMVVGAFAMGSAVILESTLSFLGLGLPPDYVSWGSIMSDARLNVNAWWLALFPGLAILATVLAFNAIGRRLNEEMGEKVEYLDH